MEKHHLTDLKKSSITGETIKQYDFSSLTRDEANKLLGFRVETGGWAIKYPHSDFLKFKPDKPVGKTKYLSPRDMSQDLFITHLARKVYDDMSIPYYFVEGEKKAMALEQAGYSTISVPGVYGWKSKGHILERLTQINIKDRICYIIFDADKRSNKYVLQAEERFAGALESLGGKVKIVNLDQTFGKGADDQLIRLGDKDFQYYVDKAKDPAESGKNESVAPPLITQRELMKRDIAPIEYFVKNLVQKKSKTLISGKTNLGKSVFVMDLAAAIAMNKEFLPERFEVVEQTKVLYLDCEMGPSVLKERFQAMGVDTENIYLPLNSSVLDLYTDEGKGTLELWLEECRPSVLIIDPLGSAWHGNANDKQEVGKFTSYLNGLINKFGISIVMVAHWRKKTKEFTSGGQMVAGSYHWLAWFETHVSLYGASVESVTITCEKARNFSRFEPFVTKVNSETLWFEFTADFTKKFEENTLIEIFDNFKTDKVTISDLVRYAKEKHICSEGTVRKLIKESKSFAVNTKGRSHFLVKKGYNEESLFGNSNTQKDPCV